MFLKTYNADFDDITATFTDQNSRSLTKLVRYSIEPGTRKFVKF